jgi:hypothetical protein
MSKTRFKKKRRSASFYVNDDALKKIELDIVHMISNKEKHYLIVVRDDFFE